MTPRTLALVLAMLALPVAPARADTIDAVMDAAEATLAGPAGVSALTAKTTCPSGAPAGSLTFAHDDGLSRSAWQHLVALVALADRTAADTVDGQYQGARFHDAIATDAAPMTALGLQADDLADSAAIFWQSLWEIAANDPRAPTLTVFELPEWGSPRATPFVTAAKARLQPLAARLRAVLECDPAVARLTPEDRRDLGYALHLQTAVLRALYMATFEQDKAATAAVSGTVAKAVAAKGFDLRRGPLSP